MKPLEILQWLLTHCIRMQVQHNTQREHKNKVLLEYMDDNGEYHALGASTISEAVMRAIVLSDQARNVWHASNTSKKTC